MKATHSGISARNIHIYKLASLAKTNSILKSFYLLFMLIGIQSAYASSLQSLSFTFNYAQGVNSVYFDQTHMSAQYTYAGKFDVTDTYKSSSYTLTVQTDIGSSGAKSITNNFNKKSPRMEVGGSDTNASSLDFMFDGILEINGHPIGESHSFVIGHENHKSSNADWWIANISDNASLYESGTSISMNVQDDMGNYYCLIQNGTNYQILVRTGSCNSNTPVYPDNWSNAKNMTFKFQYKNCENCGLGIESLVFVYDNVSDDIHNGYEYLESVTPANYNEGHEVTVTSIIQADTETATSFINKFNPLNPPSNMLQLNSNKLSQPNKLNFWVEGHLYVNGQLIASDFTLGQDNNSKWWIGSKDGTSFVDPADGTLKMKLKGMCFMAVNTAGFGDRRTIWVYSLNPSDGECPTASTGGGVF